MYCGGFLGVQIIPKWLNKAPGHIPILFGSFLELPICSPNLDPCTPYFSQKHFIEKRGEQRAIQRKIIGTIFK